MVLLTLVNVAFALVPRAVMAIRHTTMINDNITAYSTAVGPSSSIKKSKNLFMAFSLSRRVRVSDWRGAA
jgi:hypothetical protein